MQVHRLVNEVTGPVYGALVSNIATGEMIAVRARATILALGDPAPLFRHNLSGPGNTGTSYALMHEFGVSLINTSFLQIMWSETASKTFFPLYHLRAQQTVIGGSHNVLLQDLAALLPERGSHCPCGYGLPDSILDSYLASNLLTEETMEVHAAGRSFRIIPMVHAGNGGAEIDPDGATHVPNLFACGECASGSTAPTESAAAWSWLPRSSVIEQAYRLQPGTRRCRLWTKNRLHS